MRDIINAKICEDHFLKCSTYSIARNGEGLTPCLSISIPDGLLDFWAYIDFKKPNGETFKTARIDVSEGKITYNIPKAVLDADGKLEVQVVFQNANGEIWKTYVKEFAVRYSINATDDIPNKDDFITEAQKMLDEAVETAKSVEERANAGEFKGDKGDKGDIGTFGTIKVSELPKEDINNNAVYLTPLTAWVGGSGYWTTKPLTTAGFNDIVADIDYFRIVVREIANANITPNNCPEGVLTLVATDGSLIYPTMEQGTIDSGKIITSVNNRIYTKDLHVISAYKEIRVAEGYYMWAHLYKGNTFKNYIYINGAWVCIGGAKHFPIDPQINLTVKEDVRQIKVTELNDGTAISDCGFTCARVLFENVGNLAGGVLTEFQARVNDSDAYTSAPTGFLYNSTKQYWGAHFDLDNALILGQQSAVGNLLWRGNVNMCAGTSHIAKQEWVYSFCFKSILADIPTGTNIKVWFK